MPPSVGSHLIESFKMRKFLIDTDAGVDDAVALMMALDAHLRKEIRIMGITCVQGNTRVENICVNVLRTIDVAGCSSVSENNTFTTE